MVSSYRYIGFAHFFYQYGEIYTLTIWRTVFGRIRIEVQRGNDMPIADSQNSYNKKKFKENWKEI